MLPSSGGVRLLVGGVGGEKGRAGHSQRNIVFKLVLDTLLCGKIQLCHQPESESGRGWTDKCKFRQICRTGTGDFQYSLLV